MMSTIYPKLLVFLQFFVAGVMLFFSKGFFSSSYALSIFIMGLCIGLWALNHNRLGNFNIQPKHKENSTLITTGIYQFIRHPMYTSVIIMMFSIFTSTPTWIEGVLLIVLVIVLVLKAKREESLLLVVHSDYETYMKKTKLFIPYIL